MMRVLVAVDETQASLRAAREAVRLFRPSGAEFLLINVARVPTPWLATGPFGAVSALDLGWDQIARRIEEPGLEDLAEAIGAANAEVLTDAGLPVDRICAAADEHDVDVIVVGGHDKGIVARMVEPSVSAGVVRSTHRAVLVVSGELPTDNEDDH